MTLLAETSAGSQPRAPANGAGCEFNFPYRAFESTEDNRQLGFTVALTPDAGLGATRLAMADLRAAVAFLVDAAYSEVPAATLACMIGRYFFASGAASNSGTVTVSLKNTRGEQAEEQIDRSGFEVERTAFGTAHILHEDDTLALHPRDCTAKRNPGSLPLGDARS